MMSETNLKDLRDTGRIGTLCVFGVSLAMCAGGLMLVLCNIFPLDSKWKVFIFVATMALFACAFVSVGRGWALWNSLQRKGYSWIGFRQQWLLGYYLRRRAYAIPLRDELRRVDGYRDGDLSWIIEMMKSSSAQNWSS